LAKHLVATDIASPLESVCRDFDDIRDHAIIRVFAEGVRRTELTQMQIEDPSADPMARPFARVVPVKGEVRTVRAGSRRSPRRPRVPSWPRD
jgi:site-specific recombinase XerC